MKNPEWLMTSKAPSLSPSAESPSAVAFTRDKACASEIRPAAKYGVRINFELAARHKLAVPKVRISNNELIIAVNCGLINVAEAEAAMVEV